MSIIDNLREQIANHLLTHVGGDESQPWQAGHNYAMAEAARLVRGSGGAVVLSDGVLEALHDEFEERVERDLIASVHHLPGDELPWDEGGVRHLVTGIAEVVLGERPSNRREAQR